MTVDRDSASKIEGLPRKWHEDRPGAPHTDPYVLGYLRAKKECADELAIAMQDDTRLQSALGGGGDEKLSRPLTKRTKPSIEDWAQAFLPQEKWNEYVKAMNDVNAAFPPEADEPQQSAEFPARYFCNGPEGSFWCADLGLASMIVGEFDKDDEWTITDTLATPAQPKENADERE